MRSRELEDNLHLMKIQEDIKENQKKLGSVRGRLQEFGNHGDINRHGLLNFNENRIFPLLCLSCSVVKDTRDR